MEEVIVERPRLQMGLYVYGSKVPGFQKTLLVKEKLLPKMVIPVFFSSDPLRPYEGAIDNKTSFTAFQRPKASAVENPGSKYLLRR